MFLMYSLKNMRHNITEIVLKVALNTIKQTKACKKYLDKKITISNNIKPLKINI